MRAPAIMQAMPSSRLLMLTVISFPTGLRRMRLGQFCPGAGGPGQALALGDGAGGTLGRDAGFFLRADGASSPPGFDRRVPLRFGRREWDPLERDYLRLNPLENPLRVDLRPFPPWECLFSATDVMRASAGDAGAF